MLLPGSAFMEEESVYYFSLATQPRRLMVAEGRYGCAALLF